MKVYEALSDGHDISRLDNVVQMIQSMHGPVRKYNASRLGTLLLLEQVTVSGILDGHDTDSVELTSGSTEVDIGTVVVVDVGLGEHGVVLDLRLSEGRAVFGDQNELGLARSELLESLLVTEGELARLNNELELGVDRLRVLGGLALLDRGHF